MPTFHVGEFRLDISRDAVLVDTNVLVAAFLPNDDKHEDAKYYLNSADEQLIVPMAVVVETWGMVVGSRGRHDYGCEFLSWLGDPGHASLVPHPSDHYAEMNDLARGLHIDCVDAYLLCLANEFSTQCNLSPAMRIATYDTRDFLRCMGKGQLKMRLLDMKTFEDC